MASTRVNKRLRLGILLPTRGLVMGPDEPRDADIILSMAEAAEEAGLDSVWVGDSLTSKPRLEPLTTLAAVAARTRRVRLGTAVLLAALRHPVLMAHVVGSLDLISRGRAVLAVGVGGAFNEAQQREWMAAGVTPSRRATRLEELVEIVKRLSAGETVSYKGRHFTLDSVSMEPRPVQRGGVPVLIACHWESGRGRPVPPGRAAGRWLYLHLRHPRRVRPCPRQGGATMRTRAAELSMRWRPLSI